MVKFNCSPTFENNNLDVYIVFKDAPYSELNDFKFDVKNIHADIDVPVLRGSMTEITFDLMYNKAIDKNNNFIRWFKDIYSTCRDKLNATFGECYAENAVLYMCDSDTGKLLRKLPLFRVFPIEYTNEYRDDWNTISFKATPRSFIDLTEEEKKMNNENRVNNLLNKAQPYVKLISKLDEVEKYIDKNKLPPSFESVGKEFVESLHSYNSLLKDACIEIIKDACK